MGENVKYYFLLFFLFSSSFILAQSNELSFNNPCEAMVVCAFPQLVIGRNLASPEMQLVFAKARVENIILENGKVTDRTNLAELVLALFRRTEIGIVFGSNVPENATLLGYLIEITNNTESHFVLTGLNGVPLYNPCNANGEVVSSQEVYVYVRK